MTSTPSTSIQTFRAYRRLAEICRICLECTLIRRSEGGHSVLIVAIPRMVEKRFRRLPLLRLYVVYSFHHARQH
jgi:hypothetical protein